MTYIIYVVGWSANTTAVDVYMAWPVSIHSLFPGFVFIHMIVILLITQREHEDMSINNDRESTMICSLEE